MGISAGESSFLFVAERRLVLQEAFNEKKDDDEHETIDQMDVDSHPCVHQYDNSELVHRR